MPPKAVVELFGVPASGKSGLASALAARRGAVVVKEHRAADLPALLGGVVRAAPVLLARPPSGTNRLRWVAWSGRLAAAPSVVERHREADLVVLDQGPAYTLGRMLDLRREGRGNRWWESRVRETAGTLDLLVVLDAPPAALVERLHRRHKQHRATALDASAVADYLAREQETCRTVTEWLDRAGTPVLRLHTDRSSIAEQVTAVEAALSPVRDPDRSR